MEPKKAGPEALRRFAGLYGVGLCLGVYGWGALGERFHPLEILDLLLYATLVAIVLLVLPRIRWLQVPLAVLATLILATLHIGFLFYVRFYESWPTPEVFAQWRDAGALGSSFWHLLHASDLIFGVAAPLVLVFVALRTANGLPDRFATANRLAAFAIAAELLFEALAGYPYVRSQNQPLMFLLRNPVMEIVSVFLPRSKARVERVDKNIETYYPLDADLYRFDRGPKARLRKVPLEATADFHRQNVIVVLMESMRAHEFGLYGAATSLTPNLDALGAQSLVVDPFYANSKATVHAEAAVNCSVYEFANVSSILRRYTNNHLTCLAAIFGDQGYSTYWVNAYKRDFGNAYAFFKKHGTRHFRDIANFKGTRYRKIGWGPSDDDMYRLALKTLDAAPQPFYAELLTLSNHYPFTQKYPTDDAVPSGQTTGDYGNYRRGMFYADSAFGKFLAAAREKPWFQNTLLVITGDHGVRIFPDDPTQTLAQEEEMTYRVPLIVHSPAGLVPPRRLHVNGSQVDIAPTILDILGLRAPNAFVGRSLLRVDPNQPRPIFMIQDSLWNIRRGDEYCYELAEKPGQAEEFKQRASGVAGSSPRFCFRAKGDLFFDKEITPLAPDAAAVAPLYDIGLDLVFYNRFLLQRDTAYRRPAEE